MFSCFFYFILGLFPFDSRTVDFSKISKNGKIKTQETNQTMKCREGTQNTTI